MQRTGCGLILPFNLASHQKRHILPTVCRDGIRQSRAVMQQIRAYEDEFDETQLFLEGLG